MKVTWWIWEKGSIRLIPWEYLIDRINLSPWTLPDGSRRGNRSATYKLPYIISPSSSFLIPGYAFLLPSADADGTSLIFPFAGTTNRSGHGEVCGSTTLEFATRLIIIKSARIRERNITSALSRLLRLRCGASLEHHIDSELFMRRHDVHYWSGSPFVVECFGIWVQRQLFKGYWKWNSQRKRRGDEE